MNRAESYQRLFPALKRLDPEWIHGKAINWLHRLEAEELTLKLLEKLACSEGERFVSPELQVNIGGIELESPVMLGAGFDKNGVAAKALYRIGFSAIEIGTVTLFAQEGNPKPRLYHLESESLLNHLGFPNQGADIVLGNLHHYHDRNFPLGVSIGLNADTGFKDAAHDFGILAHIFAQTADYLVINISSPNTPHLATLQASAHLREVIEEVRRVAHPVPLFLKISPDLSANQLDFLIRVGLDYQLNGMIATNTTADYSLVQDSSVFVPRKGGLSGQILRQKSTNVLRHLYQESGGRLNLIGSGGVISLESLLEKFSAGAKAVSTYSGLVFKGPTFPSALNRELAAWLEAHGTSLTEIVGQKL